MNNLFYSVNGQPGVGPVTLQQYLQLNLPPDTLVWFEGQADWKKASDIPELAPQQPPAPPIFLSTPPPANPTAYGTQPHPPGYPPASPSTNRKTILYIVGGVVALFVLFKLFGSSKDKSREPYVQTYASHFAAKLMQATYPVTGKNPTYDVVDWEYSGGVYEIEVKTNWQGSCTIFDSPCDVGYTVLLHVTENGKFQDYEITQRNTCATQHQICDVALGAVLNALENTDLN